MAGNATPIFSRQGSISGVAVGGTALTDSSGAGTIGTNIFKVFTADATNGSFVQRLVLSPVATVAATATTPTTIRCYISSITSGTSTQANTWLFAEVSAPAQTADHSTTAIAPLVIPLGFILPASYTILVTNHVVNAANTSWTAFVIAGDY